MKINNTNYFLEAGNFYLTDVSKTHSVYNNSNIARIHIVMDLKYSKKLIQYIDNGRPVKIIPKV